MILVVNTSILDKFRYNFTQVAEQLIEMAKRKVKKKSGIQQYLKILKEDSNDDCDDDDDADNTAGKRTII